jgi:hypothetical protein
VRKLWYAGAAVAGGIFLLAASPAQADDQPSTPQLLPGNAVAPPFGDLLSGAGGNALNSVRAAGGTAMSGAGATLNGANTAAQQAGGGLDRVRRPTNNLHMTIPLDGSRPLTQVRPGTNSPALLPRSAQDLPPAGVIGPLQPQTSLNDDSGLLGGLPLLGGLLPSGQQQPSFGPSVDPSSFGPSVDPSSFGPSVDPSSFDRPTVGETESLPLLGGLLPDPGTPAVPSASSIPDVSGLPGGGMAVLPPAITGHHRTKPAATPSSPAPSASSPAPSASSAAPVDPRLHEEPIDTSERTFSPDTRPVAGVDQQYR